jgi:hypothetical protein
MRAAPRASISASDYYVTFVTGDDAPRPEAKRYTRKLRWRLEYDFVRTIWPEFNADQLRMLELWDVLTDIIWTLTMQVREDLYHTRAGRYMATNELIKLICPMLRRWKQEHPQLKALPAETAQSVVRLAVEAYHRFLFNNDRRLLQKQEHNSFHLLYVRFVKSPANERYYDKVVTLPKLGQVDFNCKTGLWYYMRQSHDRIKGARLAFNKKWKLDISFERAKIITKRAQDRRPKPEKVRSFAGV